jgi:hypothetical protein
MEGLLLLLLLIFQQVLHCLGCDVGWELQGHCLCLPG